MPKFYDIMDGYGYHLCDSHAVGEGLNTSLGEASNFACFICEMDKEIEYV